MQNSEGCVETTVFHAIQSGDLEAFEYFMYLHEQRLFHVILGIVHQRQEAEDITQETFLKFYLMHRKIDPDKNPAALLYHIGKNCARDWLRKNAKHASNYTLDEIKESPGQMAFNTLLDSRLDIERSLTQLKSHYAHSIKLFYLEGYSYEDIASLIGIPLNTVKTDLRRARLALRAELAL